MQRNDPLRMAGATAFFTTFSLPFIVIIIVQIFGLFVSPRFLNSQLVKKLSGLLGDASAVQIRETATSFRDLASNWYVTVLGFLFIVFVSTTLFSVIKDSLNSVWCVRVKQKPGFWFYFRTRIRAFAVIVLIGILFLAGLVTEAMEVFLGNFINNIWESGGKFLNLPSMSW